MHTDVYFAVNDSDLKFIQRMSTLAALFVPGTHAYLFTNPHSDYEADELLDRTQFENLLIEAH
jgi:hypothetical protein